MPPSPQRSTPCMPRRAVEIRAAINHALAAAGKGGTSVFGPINIFATLSLLFGSLMTVATPPLRGPDERAHFVRAYAVALGDIVPSIRDPEGRKGIFLPAGV